jgi:hypothetical protein
VAELHRAELEGGELMASTLLFSQKKKPTFSKVPGTTVGSGLMKATNVVAPTAPQAPVIPTPVAVKPAFSGDSTYFNSVAKMLADRNANLSQLDQDDSDDKLNNSKYLTQLASNQMDSNSNFEANANKGGAFYSGALGKQKLDLVTQQKVDAADALASRMASRGIQRTNLTQQYGDPSNPNDYGLTGAGLYGEAEQRWQAAQNPTGAVAAPAATKATSAFPNVNSKTGEAYTTKVINGKKVHVYSDGRKVVVG